GESVAAPHARGEHGRQTQRFRRVEELYGTLMTRPLHQTAVVTAGHPPVAAVDAGEDLAGIDPVEDIAIGCIQELIADLHGDRWEKAKLERRFDALRVDPAQVEVREDLLAAMFDGDRTRFDQIADVVAECAEASAKTRGRSERDLRIEGHGAFRVER